jgi:DNA-binding LytR/AlgR family response regulator
MRILIIEDEKPAAAQLSRILLKELPDAQIVGPLASIAESKKWFNEEEQPDLIFLDIHLADGPSFEIFKDAALSAPIIFCTAFNQYALEAFKLNSVDYLLKPVEPEDLKRALAKFRKQHKNDGLNPELIVKMLQTAGKQPYKMRFVIKVGERLNVVETKDIHFFHSAEKTTFAQTMQGKSYPLDHSLDKLEHIIDPTDFYRISRKYLVRYEAIEEVRSYSSSRLKLVLKNHREENVLVSRDRTADFKEWLDQ